MSDTDNTTIQEDTATSASPIGNGSSERIKELEEKLVEMENNWKRALADYINFKKRTEEERSNLIKMATSMLLIRLLSVLDNFENASKHLKDEGFDMSLKELQIILKDEGLEEVKTDTKDFNPETMEAVESVEGEKGKVIETTRKGYALNGKLLRPAQVKVGSGEQK
jgi:molecular chaperone GrpE